jgi:hypothetical protein
MVSDFKEKHELEVHENKALRGIFGHKRTRRMRWVGYVERMREKRTVYRIFIWQATRKVIPRKT